MTSVIKTVFDHRINDNEGDYALRGINCVIITRNTKLHQWNDKLLVGATSLKTRKKIFFEFFRLLTTCSQKHGEFIDNGGKACCEKVD